MSIEVATISNELENYRAELISKANEHADNARSESTRKAYDTDWAIFEAWANGFGVECLPAAPATVALFITAQHDEGRKVSTLRRRLASISVFHVAAGHESPTGAQAVRNVLKGIKNAEADKAQDEGRKITTRKASAVTADRLGVLVSKLDLDTLHGLRNRAILCVGMSLALRRSEIAALHVAQVECSDAGIVATLPSTKTGESVRRARKGITELDPCNALTEWLEAADITEGPIFRAIDRHGNASDRAMSARAVRNVIATTAERAELAGDWSGHSLRRGFATSAARNGATSVEIADAGGWKRGSATLLGYIDESEGAETAPRIGL